MPLVTVEVWNLTTLFDCWMLLDDETPSISLRGKWLEAQSPPVNLAEGAKRHVKHLIYISTMWSESIQQQGVNLANSFDCFSIDPWYIFNFGHCLRWYLHYCCACGRDIMARENNVCYFTDSSLFFSVFSYLKSRNLCVWICTHEIFQFFFLCEEKISAKKILTNNQITIPWTFTICLIIHSPVLNWRFTHFSRLLTTQTRAPDTKKTAKTLCNPPVAASSRTRGVETFFGN